MLGARGRWKESSILFPGGEKRITKKLFTSAQLTTLNSVGIPNFIPAPGAGKIVTLDALLFYFIFGTVQYTGGGAISAQYHGASTNILAQTIAAATIQAAVNAILRCEPANTAGGIVVPAANTGIDLVCATADFAAGDGTAKVIVETTIITL